MLLYPILLPSKFLCPILKLQPHRFGHTFLSIRTSYSSLTWIYNRIQQDRYRQVNPHKVNLDDKTQLDFMGQVYWPEWRFLLFFQFLLVPKCDPWMVWWRSNQNFTGFHWFQYLLVLLSFSIFMHVLCTIFRECRKLKMHLLIIQGHSNSFYDTHDWCILMLLQHCTWGRNWCFHFL